MSGVDTPPVVYRPFGAEQDVPYITVPIPDDAPVTPGKASFQFGFPALTMTNPAAGGIPPSGADVNGILYTVSAWCAFLQAGQRSVYNVTVAAAIEGYSVGAVLAGDALYQYTNAVDGNEDDPEVDLSGWVRNVAVHEEITEVAGQYDNYVLPGPSDYILDFDTSAGNVDFSGFIAQRDGQKLYLNNTGPGLVQVLALNGGSTALRQVRIPSDLAIVENQTLTLMYSNGVGKWLAV